MEDISEIQPEVMMKQNSDMLKSCALFETGGNYSVDEVAWYKSQMDEIDKLFVDSKTKRKEAMVAVVADMEKLKLNPAAEFKGAYSSSILQLSAKEGLGKTFG